MTKKANRHKARFDSYCQSLGRWLASNTFFYAILTVFTLQALWVAWSGAYSMAYDEFYHLGIIQEYAKGFTPFIAQPAGPAELGALARDPSFLYHYILSFPYRIIVAAWHTLPPQVIALRVLNVSIFVWGLVLYRKLLIRASLSRRVTHVILLFFTLTPTVVMVAAQLNYDNMMFLASGAALLLATDVTLRLRKDKTVSPLRLISLVTVLMAGSIVKYAFLPIALAIGVFVLMQFILAFRRKQLSWQGVVTEFRACLGQPVAWALLCGLLFVGTLFMQRIGGNLVMYHSPAPDCGAVLTVAQCRAHAAYGRNQNYKEKNFAAYITTEKKLTYPIRWYNKMMRESFFAVGPREIGYQSGAPLPAAALAGKIIMPVLIFSVLLGSVWLWRHNPIWQLFMAVTVVYVGVLYLRNYTEYVQMGIPVAIHGRYVIYVMPLVAALAAASLLRFAHGKIARRISYGFVAGLLGMMIMGGGWLPYVIRSGDNWVWPHAVPASRTLRSSLWHIIPQ